MKDSNITMIEEALLPLLSGIPDGTVEYMLLSEERETAVKILTNEQDCERWMKIIIKKPLRSGTDCTIYELQSLVYIDGDEKNKSTYAIRDHEMSDSLRALLGHIIKLSVDCSKNTANVLASITKLVASLNLSKK